MLERIYNYITENSLFTKQDKLLLAVSGGIDSAVLTHLLHHLGHTFIIAHCNFHLRGSESDEDEKFVQQVASKLDVDYFKVDFDTAEIANAENQSIQMVARDLRYQWFEKLRKETQCNFIAIAHNADDVVETFFINLIRGTGLHGLTGIKNKIGYIVRPLLFASREKIQEYANKNNITFREDSSNANIKYMRNSIRHKVIPQLQQLNPSFGKTFENNLQHIQQAYLFYREKIDELKKKLVTYKNDICSINYVELKKLNHFNTIGYEILADFNFNSDTIANILSTPLKGSGKKFFSSTHVLVTNRGYLEIGSLLSSQELKIYNISIHENTVHPVQLQFKILERNQAYIISKSSTEAHLDSDKLSDNLSLRKWKEGDRFRPLGMTTFKKLSDFFTDQKMSVLQKEKQWILTHQGEIVWVLGKRIDDRFKVTGSTKKVLVISLGNEENSKC